MKFLQQEKCIQEQEHVYKVLTVHTPRWMFGGAKQQLPPDGDLGPRTHKNKPSKIK